MGAPQVTIETITVTRPLKVIAFTCCVISVILVVAATSTSDWIVADGWREGLFTQCISKGAPTPLPFDMDPIPGCRTARGADYLRGAAALVIIGLFTDFFGTFLTGLGLRSTDPNKKYKYYRVAIYALIAALIALLLAAIIYPVKFSNDLDKQPPYDGKAVEPVLMTGSHDFDGDGKLDHLDDDDDNDGILDVNDPDDDNDGIIDTLDDDDDNDGIIDSLDGNIEEADTDGDGTLDENDDDDDGDGIPDAIDSDDDNDGIPDGMEEDEDGDGIVDSLDNSDSDDDNDGIPDTEDTEDGEDGEDEDDDDEEDEPVDSDGDGVADVNDGDDDNDGIPDALDEDDDNDGVDDDEEMIGARRVYVFGFGYGAIWGAVILIFASVVLLICDRESEEIYYKEKQVEEEEEEEEEA